jgi:hypothetical protein
LGEGGGVTVAGVAEEFFCLYIPTSSISIKISLYLSHNLPNEVGEGEGWGLQTKYPAFKAPTTIFGLV